jgi:aspartate racemase
MTARTISARWSLGVVGGLGPLARADVFFKLIKATPARSYEEQLDVVFEQHPFRNARASRAATTERKLDIFDMIRDFERRGVTTVVLPGSGANRRSGRGVSYS